jgi:hypothetical protein
MSGLLMKYFVLKPKGDDAYAVASREAMRTYAECIQRENPELSSDIALWVAREAMAAKTIDVND